MPHKKSIPNNYIFCTYEGNSECQVQNNIFPSNVPDCMFEVESVVDMKTLDKKIMANYCLVNEFFFVVCRIKIVEHEVDQKEVH